MANQTDFTQIAADFAANLESVDSIGEEAAAEHNAVVESTTPGDVSGTDDMPSEAIDRQTDLAAGDTETGNTTFIHNPITPADAESVLAEEAEAGEPVDDATSSGDALPVHDEHEAADQTMVEAVTDGGVLRSFPAAPTQPGEFTLPLCDLVIGKTSEGGMYDFDSGAGESLLHAVLTPQNIAPIVVMKTGDAWHVIDGWARVEAFRAQFGNTSNLRVRAVEWAGTQEEALYNRFAATFLTLKSRKIDKSILLRQFHLAWVVPQQVLAARIGWTESRVTRELAAAEVMLEASRFAELHVKAGDPPIDYLYKVQQARAAAAADDAAHPKRAPENGAVAKLNAKLEGLLAKPERFASAQALAKLGIGTAGKVKAAATASTSAETIADISVPTVIDCVEDSGGEPVAMVEINDDQFPSIRLLVDATAMDDRRKAEVRHLVHEALDRLLGF